MKETTLPAAHRKTQAFWPIFILIMALLPLVIMPLSAVFFFAARDGLAQFIDALRQPEAQFALRLSLITATVTAVFNGILGTYTGYVLTEYNFRGRGVLEVIVNLPAAIPTVVVGTSLLLLWGPVGLLGRLLDPWGIQPMFTPVGILLAHIFVTLPYMFGAVKPVLDKLEATYEEAAYTIGASRQQTFRYVILPALRGGILSGALLTFAHSLGEFGATVLVSGNLRLRTQTSPLYIFSQFEAGNMETANAVAAVLAALSFVIFFTLQRVAGNGHVGRGTA